MRQRSLIASQMRRKTHAIYGLASCTISRRRRTFPRTDRQLFIQTTARTQPMRYSSGTSLASLEQAVIEATDAFNETTLAWRKAEKERLEAQNRLEKTQRELDNAYVELKSRAPGGHWKDAAPRIGLFREAKDEGFKAVARALSAE